MNKQKFNPTPEEVRVRATAAKKICDAMSKAGRAEVLYHILSHECRTITDLHLELDITRRQAYLYIADLCEAGLLTWERDEGKGAGAGREKRFAAKNLSGQPDFYSSLFEALFSPTT